jgi:hypothetical protein
VRLISEEPPKLRIVSVAPLQDIRHRHLLSNERQRIHVIDGSSHCGRFVVTGAVKQHRVENEEGAGRRLDRTLDLLGQRIRWELFDSVGARQDDGRAILAGERIHAEQSADREWPRRDEMLVWKISVTRRLVMHSPGRIRNPVLLRQDDEVTKQLTDHGEDVFVGRQSHEGIVVSQAASQRFMFPDFSERFEASRARRLLGKEGIDTTCEIRELVGRVSTGDDGESFESDALDVGVAIGVCRCPFDDPVA